jgi:hypothetical protein
VSFADDAIRLKMMNCACLLPTSRRTPDDHDVRQQNGLRVSFSDEPQAQSDDEAKQQQLHAPEDIASGRQQQ